MSDVTRILGKIESGDPHAAEQLLPLVYEELRKLAAAKMAQEKPGQTLQATALVHEAYIRLVDVDKARHWDSRGHFFAAAAEAMRRILVDRARQKNSLQGGGMTVLEDISSLNASWFDFETYAPTAGWIFKNALDINEAGQIAGSAGDGVSARAAVYYAGLGYFLLPRCQEWPDAIYWIQSSNEYGEVQGLIQPGPELPFSGTFLWTPVNPGAITVIEPGPGFGDSCAGIGANTFMTYNYTLGEVLNIYEFAFNADGTLSHNLLDTVPVSGGYPGLPYTFANDSGAFSHVTNGPTTQSVTLYQLEQPIVTVHESSSYAHSVGHKINNSNDCVYNVGGIPYLYRYSENRSYRFYDVADSYTKSTLFASSAGDVKNSPDGFGWAVVSDDNVAGAPSTDSFDTIGAWLNPPGAGTTAFVLTPVPEH